MPVSDVCGQQLCGSECWGKHDRKMFEPDCVAAGYILDRWQGCGGCEEYIEPSQINYESGTSAHFNCTPPPVDL